ADCDLLVASTSSDEPVVEADELRQVLRQRRARPLLVVDLGVPRNVSPRVGKLSNVFLHDIDSLEHLLGWYQGLGAEPLVAELQRRAERIRRQEVDAVRGRFPGELQEELDRLTRA